ncbi:endonuclease/exonuclease/phosphatase family protein [Streptosporangium saharense]|uniref:Vancomycin resistance protein VanJ n=1 Tax=Streptosporangium saharense TaxID=1706840 RepID=A0A7W7VMD5_9ACTN|nr:endonuclease/exonuclease/phosphatase family protein [Streptosporangium saharense]MBB4915508.1 vancomycin resistance protein VanJ [Streptosporangium saharense]
MAQRFRGGVVAATGTLTALLLAGHRLLPNWRGWGNTLDSALPWLGLAVPLLAVAALARRSPLATAGVLVPAVTWGVMFGPAFVPAVRAGPPDLRVVHQNVNLANPDLPATAKALRAARPDILVAAELDDDPVLMNGTVDPAFAVRLDPGLRYRFPDNPGIAVWSRYPFVGRPRSVPGVPRSRWATIRTPHGPVNLYAVHLASFRPGERWVIAERNAQVEALAAAIRADPSPRIIVVGDLNTASTDREMGLLTETLSSAAERAGSGMQFTWPAALPLVRLDHVLTRGFEVLDSRVLPRSVSDHRAILADLRFASSRKDEEDR